MARGSNYRNGWIFLLMLISGIVIGGFLGELLGKYIPAFKYVYNIGVSTHTWDLIIMKLTFGITFGVSIFSILGIILAIYIFTRL